MIIILKCTNENYVEFSTAKYNIVDNLQLRSSLIVIEGKDTFINKIINFN